MSDAAFYSMTARKMNFDKFREAHKRHKLAKLAHKEAIKSGDKYAQAIAYQDCIEIFEEAMTEFEKVAGSSIYS